MTEENGTTAEWLGAAAACQVLRCSRRKLDRLVDDGFVRRQKDVGGTWRFSATDCTMAADRADSASEVLPPVEDAFREGTLLLKTAHSHLEKMVPLTAGMWEHMMKAQAAEIESLRARCRELEAAHTQSVLLREQLISQAHEREMEISKENARNERRQRVLGMLEKEAPKLIGKFAGDSAKVEATLALLQKLGPTRIAALIESDFLEDDEKELAKKLLDG